MELNGEPSRFYSDDAFVMQLESVLGQIDNNVFKPHQLEEELECELHLPRVVSCISQATELVRISRIVAAALIRIETAGIARLSKLRVIQCVECLRAEL